MARTLGGSVLLLAVAAAGVLTSCRDFHVGDPGDAGDTVGADGAVEASPGDAGVGADSGEAGFCQRAPTNLFCDDFDEVTFLAGWDGGQCDPSVCSQDLTYALSPKYSLRVAAAADAGTPKNVVFLSTSPTATVQLDLDMRIDQHNNAYLLGFQCDGTNYSMALQLDGLSGALQELLVDGGFNPIDATGSLPPSGTWTHVTLAFSRSTGAVSLQMSPDLPDGGVGPASFSIPTTTLQGADTLGASCVLKFLLGLYQPQDVGTFSVNVDNVLVTSH